MTDVVQKRFDTPDEAREFEKGRFEIVHLGTQTLGRATYQPGWKWSLHVGPSAGAARCGGGGDLGRGADPVGAGVLRRPAAFHRECRVERHQGLTWQA